MFFARMTLARCAFHGFQIGFKKVQEHVDMLIPSRAFQRDATFIFQNVRFLIFLASESLTYFCCIYPLFSIPFSNPARTFIPATIWLKKSASIQPSTSPSKSRSQTSQITDCRTHSEGLVTVLFSRSFAQLQRGKRSNSSCKMQSGKSRQSARGPPLSHYRVSDSFHALQPVTKAWTPSPPKPPAPPPAKNYTARLDPHFDTIMNTLVSDSMRVI